MTNGFYNGVASLGVQGRRLELSAQNVANASTHAFKRHVTVVHSKENARGQVNQVATEAIDFSQGELERTGRSLDFAIRGEGFFAIESPNGEAYTRNGSFELDPDGNLTTRRGMPVSWVNQAGRPDPLGPPIEVEPSGQVRQGDAILGNLKLVNFADPQELRQGSAGIFLAAPGAANATFTGELHQGALEGSNTTAIDEMVEMITIQRHFGAVTQMLSTLESSYDRITNPR